LTFSETRKSLEKSNPTETIYDWILNLPSFLASDPKDTLHRIIQLSRDNDPQLWSQFTPFVLESIVEYMISEGVRNITIQL
jgi:hypothetical protein